MNKMSVVIGRFQTPFVGNGHKHILEYYGPATRLLILIGCVPIGQRKRDPLSYTARANMLQEAYPKAIIAPIFDHPSNSVWVQHVDQIITAFATGYEVTVLYGRDGVGPLYKENGGKYSTVKATTTGNATGTQIRMHLQEDPASGAFRSGVVWCTQQQFTRVDPVVDVIIRDPNTAAVLLGQKATDGGKYRFIGGFFDPSGDKDLEMAARREVHEETGIEVGAVTYIGSTLIDDWRYKGPEKILSMVFFAEYTFGHAKAADDIEHVAWMRALDLEACIHPVHQPILRMYWKHLKGVQCTRS